MKTKFKDTTSHHIQLIVESILGSPHHTFPDDGVPICGSLLSTAIYPFPFSKIRAEEGKGEEGGLARSLGRSPKRVARVPLARFNILSRLDTCRTIFSRIF